MDAQRRVVSAILFSPRGGSSHAARALSAGLPGEGWEVSLVSGSRRDTGPEQDARGFYAGVRQLSVVDFTDALAARDPMWPGLGTAPMHPSYESRANAPDRVFASLGDEAFELQVRAWSKALRDVDAALADVLHLHHLTPIDEAAARVAPDVPVVSHLHGTELMMLEAIEEGRDSSWEHAEAWAGRLREWAARATRLVVATPGGRDRACELLAVDEDRVDVVPNGFDAERFSPATVDRDHVWLSIGVDPPQDTTFVYVGRFTEVKRIPLLIEAFANARRRLGGHASLVIVGGHPGEWEGEHPAEAIARLGAEAVQLAGWHDQSVLPDLLRASDVVVLPSVNESFGQVLVEGMACEVPAIAVDRGGPAEIVEDGETGWLVAPDDIAALEQALVDAASDPAERRRRGRQARADVMQRYTWPAATRELSTVLEAAALEHDGSGRDEPVAA